jgi:hypothetical protein
MDEVALIKGSRRVLSVLAATSAHTISVTWLVVMSLKDNGKFYGILSLDRQKGFSSINKHSRMVRDGACRWNKSKFFRIAST